VRTIKLDNNIQKYLDEQRRTQQWLADKLGKKKQQVHRYCKGETPNHCEMLLIAKAFKIKDVRKLYKEVE